MSDNNQNIVMAIAELRSDMDARFDSLEDEIVKLKFRSSFWGAVTGFLTSIAFAISSCGCAPSPLPASYGEQPSQVEHVLLNTVALETDEGDIFCSGARSGSYVVTAAHCVDDGLPVYIALFPGTGERYWAAPVYLNIPRDIAVLDVPSLQRSESTLQLAEGDPVLGDSVWACGHPYGLEWTVTEGTYLARRYGFGRAWYQVDITVSPGNSGGPLVTEDGELVGLASFRLDNQVGFIPLEYIREALYRVDHPVGVSAADDWFLFNGAK